MLPVRVDSLAYNDIQLLTSYLTNENILKIINELNKLTNEN